jgi:hypothetical protein
MQPRPEINLPHFCPPCNLTCSIILSLLILLAGDLPNDVQIPCRPLRHTSKRFDLPGGARQESRDGHAQEVFQKADAEVGPCRRQGQ